MSICSFWSTNLSYLKGFEEFVTPLDQEVMPFIREMCSVPRTLEILCSEFVVPYINDALRRIEKLDAVLLASLADGFRNFREHRSVNIPWSYLPYPGLWEFCLDA